MGEPSEQSAPVTRRGAHPRSATWLLAGLTLLALGAGSGLVLYQCVTDLNGESWGLALGPVWVLVMLVVLVLGGSALVTADRVRSGAGEAGHHGGKGVQVGRPIDHHIGDTQARTPALDLGSNLIDAAYERACRIEEAGDRGLRLVGEAVKNALAAGAPVRIRVRR